MNTLGIVFLLAILSINAYAGKPLKNAAEPETKYAFETSSEADETEIKQDLNEEEASNSSPCPKNEVEARSSMVGALSKTWKPFDLEARKEESIREIQLRLLELRDIVQSRAIYLQEMQNILDGNSGTQERLSFLEVFHDSHLESGHDSSKHVFTLEFEMHNRILLKSFLYLENQLSALLDATDKITFEQLAPWKKRLTNVTGEASGTLDMIIFFTHFYGKTLRPDTDSHEVEQLNQHITTNRSLPSEEKVFLRAVAPDANYGNSDHEAESEIAASARKILNAEWSDRPIGMFNDDGKLNGRKTYLVSENQSHAYILKAQLDANLLTTGLSRLLQQLNLQMNATTPITLAIWKAGLSVRDYKNALKELDSRQMKKTTRTTLMEVKAKAIMEALKEQDDLTQVDPILFSSPASSSDEKSAGTKGRAQKKKAKRNRTVPEKSSRTQKRDNTTEDLTQASTSDYPDSEQTEPLPLPAPVSITAPVAASAPARVLEVIPEPAAEATPPAATSQKPKSNDKWKVKGDSKATRKQQIINLNKSLAGSKEQAMHQRRFARIYTRIEIPEHLHDLYTRLWHPRGRAPTWTEFGIVMKAIIAQTGGYFPDQKTRRPGDVKQLNNGKTTGAARTIVVGKRHFTVHQPGDITDSIPNEYLGFIRAGLELTGLTEDIVKAGSPQRSEL